MLVLGATYKQRTLTPVTATWFMCELAPWVASAEALFLGACTAPQKSLHRFFVQHTLRRRNTPAPFWSAFQSG